MQVAVNRVQPKYSMDRLLKVNYEVSSTACHLYSNRTAQTNERKVFGDYGNVVEFQPDRVVLLTYNHSPEIVRVQKAIDRSDLPHRSDKEEFWALGAEMLLKMDIRIGLEHFAKPDDKLHKYGRMVHLTGICLVTALAEAINNRLTYALVELLTIIISKTIYQ